MFCQEIMIPFFRGVQYLNNMGCSINDWFHEHKNEDWSCHQTFLLLQWLCTYFLLQLSFKGMQPDNEGRFLKLIEFSWYDEILPCHSFFDQPRGDFPRIPERSMTRTNKRCGTSRLSCSFICTSSMQSGWLVQNGSHVWDLGVCRFFAAASPIDASILDQVTFLSQGSNSKLIFNLQKGPSTVKRLYKD